MKKKRAFNELFIINLNKLELNRWFFLYMLPVMILAYTSVYSFFNSTEKISETVAYSEKGSTDYKVYYKENEYYDDYLGSDMTYVAGLIDNVAIDFKYQMNIEKEVSLEYNYDVTASLIITNKDKEGEILYKSDETLLKNKDFKIIDNNFVIDENIIVNYDDYNDYVNEYKKNYSLSVSSYILVTMKINSNGEYDTINEKIKSNLKLNVKIPLSKQTIEIISRTSDFDKSSSINGNEKVAVTNLVLIVIAFIATILTICFFMLALHVLKISKIDKNIYEKTIKKYLREYDKIIVNSKNPNLKREIYKNIIKINTIEELIDAYDSVRKPIIYFETKKSIESEFIIIDDKTLYEFVLNKNDLLKKQKN